jgi:hypothetical protein
MRVQAQKRIKNIVDYGLGNKICAMYGIKRRRIGRDTESENCGGTVWRRVFARRAGRAGAPVNGKNHYRQPEPAGKLEHFASNLKCGNCFLTLTKLRS